MQAARISAFADELLKIAGRADFRKVKSLFRRGHIGEATALAQTPGALRPLGHEVGEQFMAGGSPQWMEREFLGSTIKNLGGKKSGKALQKAKKKKLPKADEWGRKYKPNDSLTGQPGGEQLASVVADPTWGISVRKIRHKDAVTAPEMEQLIGDVANSASEFAAKRFENARHGMSGKRVTFNEYISGEAGHHAVKGARGAEALKAIDKARVGLTNIAAKSNIHLADLHERNAIVFDTPEGLRAKFVDFAAARGAPPVIAQSKGTPGVKDIMRNTFGFPLEADRQQLLLDRATALRKHRKVPKHPGLAAVAAKAKKTAPKVDPRQAAIDAFLASKK